MEAEKVIYSYMRSRGLKNSEMALRSELKNLFKYELSTSLCLEQCEDSFTTIVQGLFDSSLSESFHSAFEQYIIWASSSLEIYKHDLLKFASPLFIYMYLRMIEKGAVGLAHSFFSAFSHILAPTDYNLLSSVKTPNDLNAESIKKTYFFKVESVLVKYMIYVRKSSLLLLMAFIEENKLSCILLVINQHIEILLSQESTKDVPVILPDTETFRSKIYLSLNYMLEEDKRREIKVPLPVSSQSYTTDRAIDADNRTDLSTKLPFIICHNISSNSLTNSACTSIDISEDGSLISAGFEDSSIRIWNLCNTQKNFSTLIGHNGSIISLTSTLEKLYLISSADDNEIRLWSIISMTCLTIYYFHTTPIWVVKFSPTGHYFASGAGEGSVCLWSIEYQTPLKLLVAHTHDIFSLQFHPRGTFLASGSKDKTVRIWDTATGDCVRVFCGHSSPISSLCFSRSGKILYCGDEEGVIISIDINEKEFIYTKSLGSGICSLTVSQENSIVACVLDNSSVVLLNYAGEVVKTCKVKNLNFVVGVFTFRNLLCVGGSFF